MTEKGPPPVRYYSTIAMGYYSDEECWKIWKSKQETKADMLPLVFTCLDRDDCPYCRGTGVFGKDNVCGFCKESKTS